MLTSLQALLRLASLRWLGIFICALATLLSAANTASALEPAQTKTRVWGFDFVADNSVGLFRAASSGKHLGNRLARAEQASGSLLAAEGAVLQVKAPRALSSAGLTAEQGAYLRQQLGIKQRALDSAARRGELVWSPGTESVRVAELQSAYRARVAARYKRMFGNEPDLSRLNADHPVDLLVGGSPTQPLRMLDETINKSVGASLLQAGRKAGLKPGDPIRSIEFIPR